MIPAVVGSLLVVRRPFALAQGEHDATSYSDALNWATDQKEAAYSALLPEAQPRQVVLPVCSVLTMRPGSISDDRREFRLEIVRRCDGSVVSATVAVLDEPLLVQLAKLRLHDKNLTAAAALDRIRMKQRTLGSAATAAILKRVTSATITVVPAAPLIVDAESIEVTVMSQGQVKVITYLEDERPSWRTFHNALRFTLTTAGIDRAALHYDPSEIER